ncbi:MAG: YidC/Oxa1 family membrane protein insertase [Candidatus Uhrbacteria bacterium]
MFGAFWHDVLFQPLLNALFFLYNEASGENLGIAVIELTVAIRLILLPFSIVSERKQARLESLSREVGEIRQHYRNDSVRQREEARKLFRRYRVYPWAKMVVLGVQILVLILLYQTFIGGLRIERLHDLYPFVRHPDFVNTFFLGFNVATRNVWWAIAVGVFLFVEIAFAQQQRRNTLGRRDFVYRYAFPVAAALVLTRLPMVKSIFILTSMFFSAALFGVRKGMTTECPPK